MAIPADNYSTTSVAYSKKDDINPPDPIGGSLGDSEPPVGEVVFRGSIFIEGGTNTTRQRVRSFGDVNTQGELEDRVVLIAQPAVPLSASSVDNALFAEFAASAGDSALLTGKPPSTGAGASTIVCRNALGDVTANEFFGTFAGTDLNTASIININASLVQINNLASNQASEIAVLEGARASNAPLILDNASAIGALETLTVAHTASLASAATIYLDNASAIIVLEGARASNSPLILDNASAIIVLEAARASNSPLILDNASAIGALETLTVAHTASLASAAAIYLDNASAITALEGRGFISNVIQDTTPELGGNLGTRGFQIVNASLISMSSFGSILIAADKQIHITASDNIDITGSVVTINGINPVVLSAGHASTAAIALDNASAITVLEGARASNAPRILDNASAIVALETLTVAHTGSLASAATIYLDNASAITVLEGARASNAPRILDNASAIGALETLTVALQASTAALDLRTLGVSNLPVVASAVTWNLNAEPVGSVHLTHASTVIGVAGLVAGRRYALIVTQASVGTSLTFDSSFVGVPSSADVPDLLNIASTVTTVFHFVSDATKLRTVEIRDSLGGDYATIFHGEATSARYA